MRRNAIDAAAEWVEPQHGAVVPQTRLNHVTSLLKFESWKEHQEENRGPAQESMPQRPPGWKTNSCEEIRRAHNGCSLLGSSSTHRSASKKGLKLSVTENAKEGKSMMIAQCGFLENELRQFSREEGVTPADSVETLGVDFRTRLKSVGAKEKARKKKCSVRFSLI